MFYDRHFSVALMKRPGPLCWPPAPEPQHPSRPERSNKTPKQTAFKAKRVFYKINPEHRGAVWVCERCSCWKRQRLPRLKCKLQVLGLLDPSVGQASWGHIDSLQFGTEKSIVCKSSFDLVQNSCHRFHDCSTAHPHLSTAEGPRSSHGHPKAPC